MIGAVPVHVSDHAVARWLQRVDAAASPDEVRAILSGPSVAIAARFGACVVRFGRYRALLQHSPVGVAVITVLAADHRLPTQLLPSAWGGVPPIAIERSQFPIPQGDH